MRILSTSSREEIRSIALETRVSIMGAAMEAIADTLEQHKDKLPHAAYVDVLLLRTLALTMTKDLRDAAPAAGPEAANPLREAHISTGGARNV